jgi:surface carbohydrate biosynthesis protein
LNLAAITFSTPEKNPIVIFHSDDNWLRSLVLNGLGATTLEAYPLRLHVTAAVILRTVHRSFARLSARNRQNGPFRSMLRDLYDQYLLACIDITGARVVMTFIDNSGVFRRLSRIDTDRAYFAVQNGTRSLACVRDAMAFPPYLPRISMTNFFCFGERDRHLFKKYGHRIDNFYPVGSLIGGYYKSEVSTGLQTSEFDLCFISQWYEGLFDDSGGTDFAATVTRRFAVAVDLLNDFLTRLLKETNLRLIICPRHDGLAAETAFYERVFGNRVTIAQSNRANFSTYRMIERSRLVIAVCSTTLAEVFTWGQKVMWCNIPDDDHYEMPEAGVSYFSGNDYNAFRQRVLDLLEMPQERYENLTRAGSRYIVNYDQACPPHRIIREAVVRTIRAE